MIQELLGLKCDILGSRCLMKRHAASEYRREWLSFLGDRQGAFAIDYIIWHVGGRMLFQWSGWIEYIERHTTPDNYMFVAALCIGTWRVLFLMKDGIYGYSPGKWFLGLRVVDDRTEQPIGPWRSVVRNLLMILPVLGELIVFVQMSFGRRWFDGLAHCKVIRVPDPYAWMDER